MINSIGNRYPNNTSAEVLIFSSQYVVYAPQGTHVPFMISVDVTPMVVIKAGAMIQISTTALYVRCFFRLIYKQF